MNKDLFDENMVNFFKPVKEVSDMVSANHNSEGVLKNGDHQETNIVIGKDSISNDMNYQKIDDDENPLRQSNSDIKPFNKQNHGNDNKKQTFDSSEGVIDFINQHKFGDGVNFQNNNP